MKVTYEDLHRRIMNCSLEECAKYSDAVFKPRLYTENNIFCVNNAIDAINNWQSLGENTNAAFDAAFDIFGEICLNTNESTIRTVGLVLFENVVKVRDANQLMNSIKHKNSRLKSKILTKINNKIDDASNAITSAIANINSNLKKNGVPITSKTVDTVEECVNNILSEAAKVKECDRIINNYNKISKRFNLDRIVSEVYYEEELYQAVAEITNLVDTYQMPFKNKYCFALENAYYLFSKHHMNYPAEKIIEAVTDYFIFSYGLSESNISDIERIKKISVLFEQKDFSSIDYLFEVDPLPVEETIQIDPESYGVDFFVATEADLIKSAKDKAKEIRKDVKQVGKIIKGAKKGNPEEHSDDEIKDMVNDFRKQCIKDPDNKNILMNLKGLINKIFTKTPYQIVYELPNIFGIIRTFLVLGTFAINPVIGIITMITNFCLKMTFTRKQTDKIIDAYRNEISVVKTKIEKAKNEDSKEKLTKYKESLEKDLDKIKQYARDLYTEEENDERDMYDYDGIDLDDDDWDLDEWDLNEMASIIHISNLVSSLNEGLIEDNLDGIVHGNIFKLDNDAIDTITDFSITVPVILEKEKLCESLISHRAELRENASSIKDYIRIDCLNDNIAKLRESSRVYHTSTSLKGVIGYLTWLNEMVKMNNNADYIVEMNFTNTLKLALNTLKKNVVKLSDKEKQLSNSIDVSVNNISKGLETAMMNDNREAIIKGRVLPSASKCIKIALTVGAAWAINPAIAVIGAIGAFACSKKLKAKERQLVLDDIEIELKMCERYLRQAEERNDMEKIRQIEIMQRNLQRQQQRIKYKMNVVYNQKTPEPGKDYSDND